MTIRRDEAHYVRVLFTPFHVFFEDGQRYIYNMSAAISVFAYATVLHAKIRYSIPKVIPELNQGI